MKRFLLITCASMICAAPASANLSRSAAMGAGLFIQDDSNVHTFPQSLADFSNRGIGELGFRGDLDSERSAGVHVHLKKLGVHFGAYANAPGPQLRFDDYQNVADHGRHNAFAVGAEDGLWGLMLGIGGDSFEQKFQGDPPDDATAIKETATTITVGGGLDFDYSEKANGELGARVGLGSAKQTNRAGGEDQEIKESNFDLNVTLRNWYDRGADHGKLVAIGTFGIGSGSIEYPTTSARGGAVLEKDEASGVAAGAGVGWHYPVAEGIVVVPGLEVVGFVSAEEKSIFSDRDETDELTAITYLSPFFAMEAWINSWWVARVGVKQSNTMSTFKSTVDPTSRGEPTTTEFSVSESQFDISLGVGVKLGENFMFDGVFDEDFLYAGPNFLTGGTTAGGSWISRLSIWGWW